MCPLGLGIPYITVVLQRVQNAVLQHRRVEGCQHVCDTANCRGYLDYCITMRTCYFRCDVQYLAYSDILFVDLAA